VDEMTSVVATGEVRGRARVEVVNFAGRGEIDR
jgi:hypothetical protein